MKQSTEYILRPCITKMSDGLKSIFAACCVYFIHFRQKTFFFKRACPSLEKRHNYVYDIETVFASPSNLKFKSEI